MKSLLQPRDTACPLLKAGFMKAVLLAVALGSAGLAGCVIGDASAPPPGGGSNPGNPDAGGSNPGTPDAPPAAAACTVNKDLGTLGTLAAATAQQLNVAGSQGALHDYKLFAGVPGAPNDYVMVYLVDNKGPFVGKAVTAGTYTISGADTNLETCGVCVIALGDVDPTTKLAKEVYLAQSGSVTIDSVGAAGAQLSASVTGAALSHWDLTAKAVATDTCTTSLGTASMAGTVVAVSGGGGGGGGGGAGGGGGTGPAGI
jgi:hypothetical protein